MSLVVGFKQIFCSMFNKNTGHYNIKFFRRQIVFQNVDILGISSHTYLLGKVNWSGSCMLAMAAL